MDLFLSQLIQCYRNNTINHPLPLIPLIMSCYTHKMAIGIVTINYVTSLHPPRGGILAYRDPPVRLSLPWRSCLYIGYRNTLAACSLATAGDTHCLLQVLRRLVRQVFGFRRALIDAAMSDPSLPVHSISASPPSTDARRLYASIGRMEAGRSAGGMVQTVVEVLADVSRVFRLCVVDLLRLYRLRQVSTP